MATDGPLKPDSKDSSYRLHNDGVPMVTLKIPSSIRELYPFQDTFRFFTPALAFVWGYLDEALLADFLLNYGREVSFYHHKFDKPIFTGLEVNGNRDWNHVLWAILREHWEAFTDHLCAATRINLAAKQVVRYAEQVIEIADPLVMGQPILPTLIPVMEISVIGLRTNTTQATMEPGSHPALSLPRLQWWEPADDVRLYANNLFGITTLEGGRGGSKT